MEQLRCVVVDDEPFARKGIVAYVEKIDFLRLVGECEDAMSLNQLLRKEEIDVIFLDIEMPEITGLDFIATLSNPPKIIIISAYEKYALRGYELEVIDYLLKPVSFDRFFKAANRAFDTMQLANSAASTIVKAVADDHIFVKVDKQLKKVYFNDILFVQAMGNYSLVQTVHGQEITYSSLQQLAAQLPSDSFISSHRSYMVNRTKVDAIEGNQLLIASYKLPIARNLKEPVLAAILGER